MTSHEFETERLHLRRWRDGFDMEILALNADPEVMLFTGKSRQPLAIDSEAAAKALDRHGGLMRRQDGLGIWAILNKDDENFMGWAGIFELAKEGPEIEIGYRLKRQAWGRGIATEAAGALLPHAFRQLQLSELRAVTYPDNIASRRVLEKLCFSYRGMCKYMGIDTTDYRLTRNEWLARRT